MKIGFASALLALSLPLFAQDPAAQAEVLFYKAFYLEKSPKDFAQAMTLYEQFLAAAPDHKLASEAAKQQFGLLDRTGKTKERDAFKEKYSKLLGNVVATGAGDAPAAGDPGRGAGAGGGERPARGEGGGAGRMDPAARAAQVAELEKQLEKAKAEGNEEQVKALTQQIERAKAGGGRGQGGPGGGAGGRGMGAMGKKLTEMTAEELTQFKEMATRMEERWAGNRANLDEEKGKKFDADLAAFKKALADNKLEDAQKALDGIREAMPQRRRGGGGEGAGAGAGGGTPPAGGTAGGRGGNNGGGGGTNRGGGR